MEFFKRIVLPVVLIFLGAGLVVMLILKPHRRDLFSPSFWRNVIHNAEVMMLVNEHYIDRDKVGYRKMSKSANKELIRDLDIYSGYLDSDDYEAFEIRTDQHYAGIGAEIERIDSRVTIVALFPDSPAQEAGMRVGDEIVRVGHEDVEDFSVSEVAENMRGPAGSEAKITIYRPSEGRQLDFTFTRREIDFPSVRDVALDALGIGTLRLSGFGRNTGAELKEVLDQLEADGMKGLIIDLRGNPGGLLSEAIAVAGEFLPKGTVVVSTRGRDEAIIREERSWDKPRLADYPVAILIDGNSASASEIVAGALQDLGKALIVGETSVGKGSVQRVYEFSNGDGLRLTTAMYYLPSGRTIHEIGVVPDVEVISTTPELVSLQLQRSHLRTMDEDAFIARFGFRPQEDRIYRTAHQLLIGVIALETKDAG